MQEKNSLINMSITENNALMIENNALDIENEEGSLQTLQSMHIKIPVAI